MIINQRSKEMIIECHVVGNKNTHIINDNKNNDGQKQKYWLAISQ